MVGEKYMDKSYCENWPGNFAFKVCLIIRREKKMNMINSSGLFGWVKDDSFYVVVLSF